MKKPVSILLFWCKINLVQFFIISNFNLEGNFCPLFVFNITRRVSDKGGSPFNEKGIGLDDFKAENFKNILDALTEFEMNVDDKKGDKVKIYCANS